MRPNRPLAAVLLACVLAATASAAPPPILEPSPGRHAGKEALDWAFVFASSLHADRNDMGKAQQSAALAYAQAGDFDLAAERADLVQGWRRGAVYADLAGQAAKAGNASLARTLIGKAESFATTVTGWEGKRIEAHLADALALLGDVTTSERLAIDLATNDPRQYAGRAAAAVAVGHAARGEFEAAMAKLGELDAATDFDVAWWRTLGYLEVARSGKLIESQRLQALDKASRSTESVDGWKNAEGKLEIAGDYLDLGQREKAQATVDAAEGLIVGFGDHNPVKPTFIGRLAELRHRLGQDEPAAKLLESALALVPSQLVIDVPAIYAALATSTKAVGDAGRAAEIFDQAFAAAEGLQNARPRALALTSICVQLGRSETVLAAETRSRLRRTYAGLDDPW